MSKTEFFEQTQLVSTINLLSWKNDIWINWILNLNLKKKGREFPLRLCALWYSSLPQPFLLIERRYIH